jgi:subtilisin-like proprotein convertase family protein
VWLTTVLAALLLQSWDLPVAAQRSTEPFPNFDARVDKASAGQDVRARTRSAIDERRSARLAAKAERRAEQVSRLAQRGLRVGHSRMLGTAEVVHGRPGRPLAPASPSGRATGLKDFLRAQPDAFGLSADQPDALIVAADEAEPGAGIGWVRLQQRLNGRQVFGGELTAAFGPAGELMATSNQLAPDLMESELATSPAISAEEAVRLAAGSIGVDLDAGALQAKEQAADGTSVTFDAAPFDGDVKVEQVYFPLEPGVADLAWSTVLTRELDGYYIVVSATGGELLFRKNIVNDQTQPATYSYYNGDSPAPLSPSTATPGSGVQAPSVPRQSLSTIGEHPLGDPWLADPDNITTGNNVDAGLDLVSPDGIDAGTRAQPPVFRVFDFAFNPAPGDPAPGDSPTLSDYRFGEVVNMFVWVNRYHDRLYELGFTEAFRNFQQNNFGRGGAGNDRVLAQGQDFSGTSNANFLTPPDGTSGRMQMYIFNLPTPDRTSGLDQEIILHELTHGVSNRLHANAAGLNATMSGGMGEGWSDFFARSLLSAPDEDVNGVYAMGGYSTLNIDTGFTDNYYYGIRRFPYAVMTTVGPNGRPHNPLTFGDIDPTQIDLSDGAFPRGPIGSSSAFQVHNIGEVWCSALLEVRARLINRMGWAAGNQRMLQLVVDGMKLDPANPTLVDGRNSILAASAASGGSAEEQDDIWRGFAVRGLGYSASAVGPSSSSVVEAFDLPNLQLGAVAVTADSPDPGTTPDPGETITLSIELVNPLGAPALGTTASLNGAAGVSYGTVAGGTSAAADFTVDIPADTPCGAILSYALDVNSSLGPVTHHFTLQIGTPTSTVSHTYTSGSISAPITDLNTTDIPIVVADDGVVGDVDVAVRLNHTFDGDLSISLIAPDGTTVMLSNRRGGSGDNFGTGSNDCSGVSTLFDDGAATPVSGGVAPFAGTFRPDSPLAGFAGTPMAGTWILRVRDNANLDQGTVGCVTMTVHRQLFYCSTVPGTPIVQAAPPAEIVAESVTPANGAPDPDETVRVNFPLRNVGTGATTSLVATLLPGGGVTAPSGPVSYGSFTPVDPPRGGEFTFVPAGNCGDDITATLQLSDNGVDLGTVSFTMKLGATIVTDYGPFENTTGLTIPAAGTGTSSGAPASLYPSTVEVSGLPDEIDSMTVTLNQLSHTFPGDVDILLVGPGGQRMVLMSDAGSTGDLVDVTVTFDDEAADIMPSGAQIVAGSYRPTNYGATDAFPAPAPASPYSQPATAGTATLTSTFAGSNPNGTWALYVVDDAGADVGSLDGWSLSFRTREQVCGFSACTLAIANNTATCEPGLCGAVVNYGVLVGGSCGIVTGTPVSGSFFPVGTTPVQLLGTRQDGTTTAVDASVTVTDDEAPVVTNVSVDTPVLWAPNHAMVDVAVNYDAADNCSASAPVQTTLSVASNQPVEGGGDGTTSPDWVVIDNRHVRLRAERSGTLVNRVYTITVQAVDGAGNTTTRTVQVVVPHDRR